MKLLLRLLKDVLIYIDEKFCFIEKNMIDLIVPLRSYSAFI
jgi:hypothetical protein